MRTHVILAVLKRNLMSYFSGLLGYLFMVVFVLVASFCAFNPQFFTNNLANLDQLTQSFPYLLLFIIPAITMTTWADEKRQGTDELLFTLPATDFEILLGKYSALVLVFSVALSFSLTMLGVLGYYADPDWGLLLTTYFGYWLCGATLISLGMFASALTSSVTVAFVLGTAFCAAPVFIGHLASSRPFVEQPSFWDNSTDLILGLCTQLSIPERLSEFSLGIIPLSGIVYFGSLIAFALYLNAVLISRRHWVSAENQMPMGGHFAIRVACLLLALICGNVVVSTGSEAIGLQVDLTSESLYSLSDTTDDLVSKIDKDNPVTIQAFLSPSVPRDIVNQHTRLKGLLRQYDRAGGTRIEVRFVDTTPYSEAAEEASNFGIGAQPVPSEENGRFQQVDVFMGAVISSPFDQVVIPFFESASLIEYELTRSIRTVSQKDRQTIGILRTDAQINGGFDMQRFTSIPEWRIVNELKKQYKVKEISPDSLNSLGDDEKVDVVMVALPSSLTQPQLDNLVTYVKAGNPVLLLDDPLPIINPQHSPSQEKPRQGGGGMMGMGGQQPPPEPRAYGGTAGPLVSLLDIAWENTELVWDDSNPHPQFVDLPPDYVFIRSSHGDVQTINADSDVTSGLQELIVLFPGLIRKAREKTDLEFEPLLWSGPQSGTIDWNAHFPRGMMGGPADPSRITRDTESRKPQVIAAHVHGEKDGSDINAIYVADLDFISNQIFSISQNEMHGLRLDNVKFILNCVDVLAGDNSYVALRNRRPKHRILTGVQEQIDEFRSRARSSREDAEKKAEKGIADIQEKLDKEVEEIESDTTLSRMEKVQAMLIAQQKKQREFDVQKANIEQEKERALEDLESVEKRKVRQMEDEIRFWAVILPPLPSILLGILVLTMRLSAERQTIEESRRLKE
jgi:ABC-2 type transport system permease protein